MSTGQSKGGDDSAWRESRQRAARVLREVALENSLYFATRSGPVHVSTLMDDRELMADILKMGFFASNSYRFADYGAGENGSPWPSVPVSLIALSFRYALLVCPKDESGAGDRDSLGGAVRDIETVMGPIAIDRFLLTEICALANAPSLISPSRVVPDFVPAPPTPQNVVPQTATPQPSGE